MDIGATNVRLILGSILVGCVQDNVFRRRTRYEATDADCDCY